PSFAQVNIISNLKHAEYAVAENLNQTIVFAGHPDNPQQIIDVCNQAEVCVIRGHAHWLYGNEMAVNPVAAANKWKTALTKIANGVNNPSNVYFEPWNEPSSVHPECSAVCNGTETSDPQGCFTQCMPVVNQFINALHPLPGGIKLTSPSIDPHNQENTPAEMFSYLNKSLFDAYSAHAYSPSKVDEILNNYGDKPIIFTETGVLVNGEPTYEEMPLCAEMYCKDNTIDKLQSVAGFALFSLGPDGISWNLWEAECVIDALKGDCHCETCEEEGGKKGNAKEIVDEIMNRESKSPADCNHVDENPECKVSRNWIERGNPNNTKSLYERFISGILQLLGIQIDLFRAMKNPFSFLSSYQWQPTDKMEEEMNRPWPGEDSYANYFIQNEIIDLPGVTAEYCVEPNTITHDFYYFPDQHLEEFEHQTFVETSIHEQTFRGLLVLSNIVNHYAGYTYTEDKEFLNIRFEEEAEELEKRAFEDFTAGTSNKALPGEFRVDLIHEWAEDYLFDAITQKAQQEGKISIMDNVLYYICEGGGVLVSEDFPELMEDNRMKRVEVPTCEDDPVPIFVRQYFCCNPGHFEGSGYDYNEICGDIPKDWYCKGDEPLVGDLLYTEYPTGKMIAESLVSKEDLPVYYEVCYPAAEDECKKEEHQVMNGFFIDLTPSQRFDVAPIFTDTIWDKIGEVFGIKPDKDISNTFFTNAEGKCWMCQINKLFVPHLLGALDTCNRMSSMTIPEELYIEMKENAPKDTVKFSCDIGKVPNADYLPTGGSNINYRTATEIFGHEGKTARFNTTSKINNSGTSEEGDIPGRKHSKSVIKSRSRLYVPRYEEIRKCVDYYFGIMPNEAIEEIEMLLAEENEHKIDPRDMPAQAELKEVGSGSSLDAPGDNEEDYLDPDNYGKIWGRTDVDSAEKIPEPGGVLDPAYQADVKFYYPEELHEPLGI
ncbi:MAG: hypothetical protein R6U58_03570, partial [Bacteroidales bacterium]